MSFLPLLLIAAALAGPLDDLAWMTGTWRGGDGATTIEEHWSAPIGENMVGSFRLLQDGQPVFYELLAIELEGEVPTMRLRHFDPGLRAWERRRGALSFSLMEHEEGRARFVDQAHDKQLVYQRDGDQLVIQLFDERGEHRFELQRVGDQGSSYSRIP
jgi:hypothetical protein